MVRSDGQSSRLPEADSQNGRVELTDGTLPSKGKQRSKPLYRRLCTHANLWRAWFVVQQNGKASRSARTRAEISEFAASAPEQIHKVAYALSHSRYVFSPARGVAIPKGSGKGKRPVVMAPVPNRIVQRAILDILQSVPAISATLNRGVNFGGIAEAGVPVAIEAALRAARESTYFVRTDIKAFFVNVPREQAVALITREFDEPRFAEIVRRATITELDNVNQLGRDRDLFPLEEIGVAQGSALSPLLCNLFLDEFDRRMNARGIRCIRYIDDFILFAPSRERAMKALAGARKYLSSIGSLDCYDPVENPDKAEQGLTENGFEFLGAHIRPDGVRPSRKAIEKLFTKIDEVFETAFSMAESPREAAQKRATYVDVLQSVSLVIRGWGNSYAFCTDDRLMRDLDRKIDERLKHFRRKFFRHLDRLNAADQRRLFGVYLLDDCNKSQPIRELVRPMKTSPKDLLGKATTLGSVIGAAIGSISGALDRGIAAKGT